MNQLLIVIMIVMLTVAIGLSLFSVDSTGNSGRRLITENRGNNLSENSKLKTQNSTVPT